MPDIKERLDDLEKRFDALEESVTSLTEKVDTLAENFSMPGNKKTGTEQGKNTDSGQGSSDFTLLAGKVDDLAAKFTALSDTLGNTAKPGTFAPATTGPNSGEPLY